MAEEKKLSREEYEERRVQLSPLDPLRRLSYEDYRNPPDPARQHLTRTQENAVAEKPLGWTDKLKGAARRHPWLATGVGAAVGIGGYQAAEKAGVAAMPVQKVREAVAAIRAQQKPLKWSEDEIEIPLRLTELHYPESLLGLLRDAQGKGEDIVSDQAKLMEAWKRKEGDIPLLISFHMPEMQHAVTGKRLFSGHVEHDLADPEQFKIIQPFLREIDETSHHGQVKIEGPLKFSGYIARAVAGRNNEGNPPHGKDAVLKQHSYGYQR